MLSVINKKNDSFVYIKLEGNLDSNTYSVFQDKAKKFYGASQQDMIIDMSELQYISSAGLRSLAILFKDLAANKAKIFLLQPQDLVKEVLTISGFTKLMPISDSLEDLLKEN